MPFPTPEAWNRYSKDAQRDESKRKDSPCSFFYSQGRSLVLAAEYFVDERLGVKARDGVALKHRHKIHLALFGQLMASFEYLLKDFVAKSIDLTAVLDLKVQKAKWMEIDAAKVLSYRLAATTPGSILVHSTSGWHSPDIVNSRYQELYSRQPIAADELPTLEKLWVLRHSVAHNAGFVIHYDASRIGSMGLAESVANVDAAFVKETFEFLCPIAERIASTVGDKLLVEWLQTCKASGSDYDRDAPTYTGLKKLASMVKSRTRDVASPTSDDYQQDFARV